MKARPHPDQSTRLRVLQSYGILDTPPEGDFDDVVQLISQICDCPIVLISLVEENRQWFKARLGLDVSETDMNKSICSHAILSDEFLEVPDTRLDIRTADNPLTLQEDPLLFYAGAVLRSREGLPLGTLCVLDRKPRQLTQMQRDAMRVMANQVMAQLELRRALDSAEVLRREVDHRVKNSLQSVTAMMRMQSRHTEDEDVREALEIARLRIETVTALHEQLYTTDCGAQIDLARFAENVCMLLARAAPQGVTIRAKVDPILTGSRQAAAIGAILNEFGTNSLKHAFPDDRSGTVLFTLTALPGGGAELTCQDDGVGMAPEATQGRGLGLKVLQASAQQLGSEAVFDHGVPGTRVSLIFDTVDEETHRAAE